MKISRNTLVVFIISYVFLINQVSAKMISLERVEKKVEQALSSAVENIKDKIEKNIEGTTSKKENTQKRESLKKLAKALTLQGNAVFRGANVFDDLLEEKIEEINQYIATIKWANQDGFIKQLEAASSDQNARQILHDKILEKYSTTKAPLISFANDVTQEEEKIVAFEKDLAEFAQKNKNQLKPESITTLENTLNMIEKFKSNIEKLGKITNQLL